MSTDKINMQAEPRSNGRRWSRSLRRDKQVPAVAYGPKIDNVYFSIADLDAERYLKREFENTIVTLKSSDKKLDGLQLIRKTFDVHPVSRKPIHIDYYALDMTKTVKVNVTIVLKGTSQGEKDGGMLNVVRREIEVECLPTDIPEEFTVDISGLNVNDSVTVKDLNISESYKSLLAEDETIASITPAKEEEEEAPSAAPVEGAAADAAAAPADGDTAAPADGGGEEKKEENKD